MRANTASGPPRRSMYTVRESATTDATQTEMTNWHPGCLDQESVLEDRNDLRCGELESHTLHPKRLELPYSALYQGSQAAGEAVRLPQGPATLRL